MGLQVLTHIFFLPYLPLCAMGMLLDLREHLMPDHNILNKSGQKPISLSGAVRCLILIIVVISGIFSSSQKTVRIYLYILNKEQKMKEILLIIAFIFIWNVLQVHILPRLGIST
jgi:hypothetical protein